VSGFIPVSPLSKPGAGGWQREGE